MSISPSRIHSLLNPTAIAIVGASDDSPWSQGFVKNLRSFAGPKYMVNPRRETAFGERTYASLRDVPDEVDHAIVLVAAHRVAGVLKDAAAAHIRSATVVASGFGDSGGQGRELAEELSAVAAEHSIALIGPNCFGFNNYAGAFVSRFRIDIPSEPGAIGMSFQSGQMGAGTADAASARGIHLRYVVSSGNELVVDFNDYLEYFLDSDDIRVTGGMIERIPEPDRFAILAQRALQLGKPIVLIKTGRSAAASSIALAHTGAISGQDAATDAFLRDLGVIRVNSVEELAETAGLLASRGWPRGNRTVFMAYSGGASELFADQAENTSIELPTHPPTLLPRLAEIANLAPETIHNPFDITADGDAVYEELAEALAASGSYDAIVSQGQPKRSFEVPEEQGGSDARRERNSRALVEAAARNGVFATFLDTSDHQPGIGVFSRPAPHGAYFALGNNGVMAISNAIDYGVRRAQLGAGESPVVHSVDDMPSLDTGGPSPRALDETTSKALLRAYGIATSEDVVARTADEAVTAASRVGYPVVLKVIAAEIAHKSDVGGVVLNLSEPGEVRAAFDSILTSVGRNVPEAKIDGVIVSRFATGGTEFIAGITNDPHLGPMVVAGLGGIYVEVFKDAVTMRPPFSQEHARRAIRSLRSAALLEGVRGGPALDAEAFADTLCRLGQLAVEQRERLAELDINPLLVFAKGDGVLAVDALAVVKPA